MLPPPVLGLLCLAYGWLACIMFHAAAVAVAGLGAPGMELPPNPHGHEASARFPRFRTLRS